MASPSFRLILVLSCALSVAMAIAGAARADTPDGAYWLDGGYHAFCSEAQRDMYVAHRRAGRAELERKEAQAEAAHAAAAEKRAKLNIPVSRSTPFPDEVALGEAQRALRIFDDNLAALAKGPVVDCNGSNPDENRPPAWAGNALPKSFDPAAYRPRLPSLPQRPTPYRKFCSDAHRHEFLAARDAYKEALAKSIITVRAFIGQLEALKNAYRKQGNAQASIAAIQADLDIYAPMLVDLLGKYDRYDDLVNISKAPEPTCVDGRPAGSGTSGQPARPQVSPSGTAPDPSPASPKSDAECTKRGGLMGGVEEVECEIKKPK
jgi:hypothetical protein